MIQAAVLIAPVFTLERFNDEAWAKPGRTMYERGSLKLYAKVVPLLVDHDWDKVIGRVTSLAVMEWADGPWFYAKADVTDPPAWLKAGTKASFGFGVVHERELNVRDARAEALAQGFVNEVSVLSPARKPAEPRAHVVYVGEATKKRDGSAYTEAEVRRRLELAAESGIPGAVERELDYLKRIQQRA